MTKLIENTLQLLNSSCAPEVMAVLDPNPSELMEAASILEHYRIPDSRRVKLLALFVLLELARKRHANVCFTSTCLTRKILDGDYFQSLYIQLAMQFEEMELVRYLAPLLKKYYIRQALGKEESEPLTFTLQAYLQREQAAERKNRAI
ncbi:hypothetical protein P4H66_13505 [Paenibacillus dokdonensis]|uniref:Uncharacterized protein n=1 Tax=Paenibacillus dokdonensis TaxID=2567944 RepID=A0ABU6GP35_9BACL|nr:hypothetical protein [Paenibacillus dokdonensis]MEC0240867.1 hypothetical protein [Paenibacillus dokdonensis]